MLYRNLTEKKVSDTGVKHNIGVSLSRTSVGNAFLRLNLRFIRNIFDFYQNQRQTPKQLQ